MDFEVLKRSNLKKNIIIGMVVVLIFSAVILTFTRAKYKTTASIPLVNGTINYDLSDLNLIGVYIQEGEEYIQTNEIPSSGYEFNSEESYCTINSERDDTITLSFDMTTQNLTVTPLTKKGTKCYLYFDEQLCPEGATACNTIIAASKPQGQTTDWTGGTTYYYTGKPNNWVQVAGFWWRIIRINGDGSIRMIYQGTSANEIESGTQIQTSDFNSSPYGSYYVGLVHDGSSQHGSGQNSTIMTSLNNWYNDNIENNDKDLHYEQYIDTGAGFCSDRNLNSGSSWSTYSYLEYAAYGRLVGSNSPILQCSDADILSQDNGRLPNPIGLITADEAALAGVTWSNPQSSYLNTGQNYWTMSPCGFDDGYYEAYVFYVNSSGKLDNNNVNHTYGVRPVINIRADVQLTGSGTTTDPFVVVTS